MTFARMHPRPFFMRPYGFIAGLVILALILLGLSLSITFGLSYQGFSYLTNTQTFASQALWSFLPTLVATLIAAAWTSIHRDLSVLEPWVALQDGAVRAEKTISLSYSARPPVATLATSIMKHNFVITLVSLACVGSFILNVAIGGLFTQSFATTPSASRNIYPIYSTSRKVMAGLKSEHQQHHTHIYFSRENGYLYAFKA